MESRSHPRAARVASQLQRSLAELLRRGVKDPRVGNVTITAVALAPDLSVARIHCLPFAQDADAEQMLRGLRSAAGFLRGELARALGMRHMPRLEFRLDTELQRAQRLTGLIDQAVRADRSDEEA
jgi:ribosome-binding factor A